MANLHQHSEEIFGWNDEAAFAQHRLGNYGSHVLRCDHALESVFKMAGAEQIARRILQRIRAAIAVGVRNAVNIARKGSEAGFVGMSLAGQRQRHHGAAVKGILESDDAGASGMRPRNLHRILHRFSAAIHKESFLGELARRDLVHALGQTHVSLRKA